MPLPRLGRDRPARGGRIIPAAMNAAPSGSIQNPSIGRKPNTPPTMNNRPITERTPVGTWL